MRALRRDRKRSEVLEGCSADGLRAMEAPFRDARGLIQARRVWSCRPRVTSEGRKQVSVRLPVSDPPVVSLMSVSRSEARKRDTARRVRQNGALKHIGLPRSMHSQSHPTMPTPYAFIVEEMRVVMKVIVVVVVDGLGVRTSLLV
jgi:hypothetical protein